MIGMTQVTKGTKGMEVSYEHLCRTAGQLQDEIAKCLTFMRESRACIESGRLPMFANTHQTWCVAEEALHTVWVSLHYDAISHGVGRSDLQTAWGVRNNAR